jgi:hypothetical protein
VLQQSSSDGQCRDDEQIAPDVTSLEETDDGGVAPAAQRRDISATSSVSEC